MGMENNTVELTFDKKTPYLAGFDFGKATYEQQVSGRLDLTKDFVVTFPTTVEGAASSFVQGLFNNMIEQIGITALEDRLTLQAKDEKTSNEIRRRIECP